MLFYEMESACDCCSLKRTNLFIAFAHDWALTGAVDANVLPAAVHAALSLPRDALSLKGLGCNLRGAECGAAPRLQLQTNRHCQVERYPYAAFHAASASLE
jgi:hypothetical protein